MPGAKCTGTGMGLNPRATTYLLEEPEQLDLISLRLGFPICKTGWKRAVTYLRGLLGECYLAQCPAHGKYSMVDVSIIRSKTRSSPLNCS